MSSELSAANIIVMFIAAQFFGSRLTEGLGSDLGLVALHKVKHITESIFGLTEAEVAIKILVQSRSTIHHKFCEFLEVQILLATLSIRSHIVSIDLGLVFVNQGPLGEL